MTRDEAISLLTQVNHILVNSNSWLENTHEPLNMAFDMAIKALEQIDVLNKIKEEIKDNTYFINETTEKEGIDFETVEKIIDKYRKGLE